MQYTDPPVAEHVYSSLTVPFELRARLAYDGELLGGVSRELATAVQDFYRRRFEPLGVRGGKTGSVTVVQRSNSDLRFLVRQGAVVETRPLELADASADATDAESLSQLAAAAVTGKVPAGPELRQREPVVLRERGEVRVTGALLASDGGFTLHAATVAAGHDAAGREALVRYALRPPSGTGPRRIRSPAAPAAVPRAPPP